MKVIAFLALMLALVVLHHDFWNWSTAEPLLFGVFPIGLTWQAGFAVGCSVLMWLLVEFAWPKQLEEMERHVGPGKADGEGH